MIRPCFPAFYCKVCALWNYLNQYGNMSAYQAMTSSVLWIILKCCCGLQPHPKISKQDFHSKFIHNVLTLSFYLSIYLSDIFFFCLCFSVLFSLFLTAQITCDSHDTLKEKGNRWESEREKLTLKLCYTHTHRHKDAQHHTYHSSLHFVSPRTASSPVSMVTLPQ